MKNCRKFTVNNEFSCAIVLLLRCSDVLISHSKSIHECRETNQSCSLCGFVFSRDRIKKPLNICDLFVHILNTNEFEQIVAWHINYFLIIFLIIFLPEYIKVQDANA
jgi:hypothetical protein